MINNIVILRTINDLDLLYNTQPAQSTYYSKLAILECCGWLEMTMDYIVSDYAKTKLVVQDNINFVDKEIVKKTYGFHYDRHFRNMLMKLVGIIKLEQIESPLIASGDLIILKAQLELLHNTRNKAAHTHIVGTTVTYAAPSTIKSSLNVVYPILQKFEAALGAI